MSHTYLRGRIRIEPVLKAVKPMTRNPILRSKLKDCSFKGKLKILLKELEEVKGGKNHLLDGMRRQVSYHNHQNQSKRKGLLA